MSRSVPNDKFLMGRLSMSLFHGSEQLPVVRIKRSAWTVGVSHWLVPLSSDETCGSLRPSRSNVVILKENFMKSLNKVVLASLMILALAACNQRSQEQTQSQPAPAEPPAQPAAQPAPASPAQREQRAASRPRPANQPRRSSPPRAHPVPLPLPLLQVSLWRRPCRRPHLGR